MTIKLIATEHFNRCYFKFILVTLLVLPVAASALDTPPVPGPWVISSCHDELDTLHQYSYCTNRFGGSGVEAMLDVTASLLDTHPFANYERTGGERLFAVYTVAARGALPPGYNGEPIPITISAAYDAYVTAEINATGTVDVSVVVSSTSGGVGISLAGTADFNNPTIADLATSSGSLPLGGTVNIQLTAEYTLYNADYQVVGGTEHYYNGASETRAVVDPFMEIDPTWEFAPYFAVYGQDGVEITRDWMAAPVPSIDPFAVYTLLPGLLVGAGLLTMWRRG